MEKRGVREEDVAPSAEGREKVANETSPMERMPNAARKNTVATPRNRKDLAQSLQELSTHLRT